MCYRETGDAKYLKHAERIADFIMHHPNTPADRIPYWDYNAPDIPDAPRDASAAAVVSSALFELSTLVPEAEGKRYFDYAETLLMNLSSDAYLARKGANGGFILMHSVGHLPQATFVVNSGTGLHLYYVLKEPVPMYPYNQKCLKELKYSLTRQIWNKFTSTIKEPQMQGILQGFRVVGSGSKLGREYPVRAFRLGGPVELARLLDYIPDSNGEQQRLEGLMRKSRLSLAEAKEKYPDWYERRIIKKERRGRWTVKRDLYDWWLHRIADEIRVGHRFYGIMTLAIYAKKCGIDEDELRRDAFALLRPYDDMSVEDINRFTKDDVVCALEMFNEDYVTFPRDDIAKLSGLTMPVNKRNWRKQPVHLQGARAIQEINDKANGTNWREGNGRPKGSGTAQARVYEWRQQHPEGRKADCHRETGLDPKTVRKWWDCPPPAVRFENGHITVRVSPSQELSDWLLDALHDGGQE